MVDWRAPFTRQPPLSAQVIPLKNSSISHLALYNPAIISAGISCKLVTKISGFLPSRLTQIYLKLSMYKFILPPRGLAIFNLTVAAIIWSYIAQLFNLD